MSESHEDIRRLLRGFGIQADEALNARLKEAGGAVPLRVRIRLEEVLKDGTARELLSVHGEIGS